MTAQSSPDLPASLQRGTRTGAGACRAQYPRPANVAPKTRIIRCHLPAGHPGEHEEEGTEVTWLPEPTTCDQGVAGDFCALLAGHDGACNPTVRLVPKATAGQDVYQAAAAACLDTPTEKPFVLGVVRGDRFRAAVDRAVELTEQRVRAQMTVDRDAWGDRAMKAEADLETMTAVARSNKRHVATMAEYQDKLTADLAAVTARAESAEAMARDADVDERTIDGLADTATRLTADVEAHAIARRSAEAMYDRLRPLADACRRYLDRPDSDTIRQAVRAYDQRGPETGLSATLRASEGQDGGESGSTVDRGSEGISGGAA